MKGVIDMFGYVKREKVLAELRREMEFNWNLQKHYGEIAAVSNDPKRRSECLDMVLEYQHRWSESAKLYNILKQLV